ncbi:MAG: hypothetical protein SVX38_11440, partial [Chloroflexota bacterium]|nr:hypothetical protein [Chloroflexota bacterium]
MAQKGEKWYNLRPGRRARARTRFWKGNGNGVGMAYYAGVDLGSITIKVALLGDEGLVASALDFAGYD